MAKLPEPATNMVFPTGTYLVKIQSFERTTAKTGTQQIRWKAEIVEPKEHVGRIIVEHTALTEKAMWKVANLIGACGVTFQPNVDSDSGYFTGLCGATIGRKSYWRVEEAVDNKGNPCNEIVRFEIDTTQDPTKFEGESEPEWLDK